MAKKNWDKELSKLHGKGSGYAKKRLLKHGHSEYLMDHGVRLQKQKHFLHKHNLYLVIAIYAFFIVLGTVFLYIESEYVGRAIDVPDDAIQVQVNYDSANKTIELAYGTQDKWCSKLLINSSELQNNHVDVGTEYSRVWISRSEYPTMLNTMPLQDDCITYNYTNLKSLLQTFLNVDTIPIILFREAPSCMSQGGIPDEQHPPINYETYTKYIGNVTNYLYNACNNGELNNCQDLNEWMWIIWNEPNTEIWFDDESQYVKLYNMSYRKIKSIIPNTKIGSASLNNIYRDRFLKSISSEIYPDFIPIHVYSKARYSDASQAEYNNTEYSYFLSWTKDMYYNKINSVINDIKTYDNSIEVYNVEYNMDSVFSPTVYFIHNKEGATWYASALMWQVLSNINGECFFEGTENFNEYGMWNNRSTTKPTYHMKKEWTARFQSGRIIYNTLSEDEMIEVMCTDLDCVVINKYNDTIQVMLEFQGKDVSLIQDQDNNVYNAPFLVALDPYDVDFYSISTDEAPPAAPIPDPTPAPFCGDNICQEDCSSCEIDCGECITCDLDNVRLTQGSSIQPFDLNDCFTNALEFQTDDNTPLLINIDNGVVTITAPGDYEGVDQVQFTAILEDGSTAYSNAVNIITLPKLETTQSGGGGSVTSQEPPSSSSKATVTVIKHPEKHTTKTKQIKVSSAPRKKYIETNPIKKKDNKITGFVISDYNAFSIQAFFILLGILIIAITGTIIALNKFTVDPTQEWIAHARGNGVVDQRIHHLLKKSGYSDRHIRKLMKD